MDPTHMEQFVFRGKTVFKQGSGPSVIVCHEVAGLSPQCLDLAERICQNGFTVFVPLLYGSPGQDSMLRGAIQLCLTREFRILSLNQTSPVADWLRDLADEIAGSPTSSGVGVIGMCATGGIVLATLLSPSVRAVIASQPSLPIAPPVVSTRRRRRNLGLSPDHVKEISTANKPVLAMRFKHDLICPKERLQAINEELPAASVQEVPATGEYDDAEPPIHRFAHAILTYDFKPTTGHPTQQAFEQVIGFLKQHL